MIPRLPKMSFYKKALFTIPALLLLSGCQIEDWQDYLDTLHTQHNEPSLVDIHSIDHCDTLLDRCLNQFQTEEELLLCVSDAAECYLQVDDYATDPCEYDNLLCKNNRIY